LANGVWAIDTISWLFLGRLAGYPDRQAARRSRVYRVLQVRPADLRLDLYPYLSHPGQQAHCLAHFLAAAPLGYNRRHVVDAGAALAAAQERGGLGCSTVCHLPRVFTAVDLGRLQPALDMLPALFCFPGRDDPGAPGSAVSPGLDRAGRFRCAAAHGDHGIFCRAGTAATVPAPEAGP